jgi:hypothetical protein
VTLRTNGSDRDLAAGGGYRFSSGNHIINAKRPTIAHNDEGQCAYRRHNDAADANGWERSICSSRYSSD